MTCARGEAQARAWMLRRAKPVTLAMIANLRTVRDASLPYATRSLPVDHDAIVCGAGPSLTALLPQIAQAGGVLYTVNSAAPAVAQVRRPDVIVAREVSDCSPHLRESGETVLDIGASPEAFRVARSLGRVSWFMPAGVHLVGLAATLGVRPLDAGSAALTAAVALAIARGARSVWLCGVDLAYADDGRAYADGSAYAGQPVAFDDEGRAHVQGESEQRAAHERAGMEWSGTVMETELVRAFGGVGSRRSIWAWSDQARWLEALSTRAARYHVAGGGRRLAGWREVDTLPAQRPATLGTVAPSALDWRALDASVAQQCATARAWAEALESTGAVVVPHAYDGADLVEAAISGRLIQIREAELPISERVRGLALCFARGADEVEAAWGS